LGFIRRENPREGEVEPTMANWGLGSPEGKRKIYKTILLEEEAGVRRVQIGGFERQTVGRFRV